MALPCVAVIVALGGLVFAYRELLAPLGKGDVLVEDGVLRRVAAWAKAKPELPSVVMFDDSLDMCKTPPNQAVDTVSRWIADTMSKAGAPVEMFDLGQPGLRPLHYYALLDEVLAKPVGLLVIEINLRSFVDPKIRPGPERLPQVARKLGVNDALRVRRNLELDGLSLLDPPIARLKEQLGLLYVFEGVRQLALDRLAAMGFAANELLGLPALYIHSSTEFNSRVNQTYVFDYASHPVAGPLRAIAEDLHAANVPFFFYVAPFDVERGAANGQYEHDAMVARLDELRRSLGASEAEWLDLHDQLHDSSLFRDQLNHLTLAGCPRVARPIAQRALHRLAHAARDQVELMRRSTSAR